MVIDLRSDTVTKPSPKMMDIILRANVGDDVYEEDPTVNALQDYFKNLFKMDEALYFPTGSMANQAAIKLHTQPGDALICDKWAHVYNFEAGGAAYNSGVTCKLIDGDRGMVNAAQVLEAINPPDFYHSPFTSLVCLENTTNKGGGACYDFNEILKIKAVCEENNLALHLDGARLMNALVAKNETPQQYGEVFDTISVCLSKGLGAPIGTVLMGKKSVMQKARRIRKVMGGAMRQIGFMAAAGLYAINNNVERLAIDHQKAKEIANTLKKQTYIYKVEPVETNIVIFYLKENIPITDFISKLNDLNVKISSMGQGKLRIVTHLDYTDEQHHHFLEILSELKFLY